MWSQGNQLSALLTEQKCTHLFVPASLVCPHECSHAIECTIKKLGRIDILVNNAGVNDAVGLDASTEKFVKSLYRNLVSAFSITHFALPFLKESRSPAIVNVLSKVFTTGQGGTSGYAASKGGLASLTREWALELLNYNIRVNAVVPAEVMTTGYERWLALVPEEERKAKLDRITSSIPLGRRMTTPEEIAKSVLFLASEDSSHTTGQFLFVDGGYSHLDRSAVPAASLGSKATREKVMLKSAL